jgi:hypothetical protein
VKLDGTKKTSRQVTLSILQQQRLTDTSKTSDETGTCSHAQPLTAVIDPQDPEQEYRGSASPDTNSSAGQNPAKKGRGV